MPAEEQLSLDDLLGFTPPSTEPSPEELAEKDARKILNTWASKSGRAQSAVEAAVELFKQHLLADTSRDDLKHVITHRTLLASKKKITADMLTKALAGVEADKQAGQQAKAIFEAWHDQWYPNRYTQPIGQIVSTVKSTLLDGVHPDHLRAAMDMLGRRAQVITGPSIQFALSQVARNLARREQAGAHAGTMLDAATRRELFRSQRQEVGTPDWDEAPF